MPWLIDCAAFFSPPLRFLRYAASHFAIDADASYASAPLLPLRRCRHIDAAMLFAACRLRLRHAMMPLPDDAMPPPCRH